MATNAIEALPYRLRASPNYALTYTADGACYVAGECEPYSQFWLNERERLAFALFGRRSGMPVAKAIDALVGLGQPANDTAERKRVARTIGAMHQAGVLIDPAAELSRYDQSMARDYLDHRPFPRAIAERIVALGRVNRTTPVLDLAAGPGNLALELARHSDRVTAMELSRGFVAAARAEASARGVKLGLVHENCNRLPQHDGRYDAITISQALHWLDDVAVAKGVSRCLDRDGSFFVVHGALSLPHIHPLSYVLGRKTPLGDKGDQTIAQEAGAVFSRVQLLFAALDTPDVARHDPHHAERGRAPIGGAGISLFSERRRIDAGFARAFLSDSHIAAMGMEREQFWSDLEARCAAAEEADLTGTQEFALLHFRRGADQLDLSTIEDLSPAEI